MVGAGVVPAPVARALLPCLPVRCGWHPESGSSLYPRLFLNCMQLASFQDLLRTQTEVVLCERLNHEFVKVGWH